ncbi:MAG: pilus assembly protein [Planctomycetaceae bacterium]|nr:MAG: pilus assembly protein [Planctomycetaceae bacterium]
MNKIADQKYRGTMVVEAAIIFPVLLMLTLGAIEYGWLFLHAQMVTNAARQGARIATLPYGTAEADARLTINSMLAAVHLDDDGPTVNVTRVAIPGDPEGRMGVTVTISVPTANLLIVNAPLLFPAPDTLRATVTMAREGGTT